MWLDDDGDRGDATCIHCGTAIYFDVGMGSDDCPSCGKNYSKTDEKVKQEKEHRDEQSRLHSTAQFHFEELAKTLDNSIFSLGFYEGAPVHYPEGVVEKALELKRVLYEVRKKMFPTVRPCPFSW